MAMGSRMSPSHNMSAPSVARARDPWSQGLHSARPTAGAAPGSRYFETDTGVLYFDTGTTWQAATVGQVVKTGDETVNNSAVLQNDDHLKFPIEIGEAWFVEALLVMSAASANADWMFGWTGPTNATAVWGAQGGVNGAGYGFTGVAVASTPGTLRSISTAGTFGGANGTNSIFLGGWFTAVDTAGTIQLQWAQGTQTAEDSKVLKNSMLRLRRLV